MSFPVMLQNLSGGMNLFDSPFNILDTQYDESYNLRSRDGTPQPILLPVEDETLPMGNKQGIYAFDNYMLAFVNGKAYYKNIVTASAWTLIADFLMSASVDLFYVVAIPAASFKYDRKLIDAEQIIGNGTNQTVTSSNTIKIGGSSAGLLVQDGINQPWVINADGTARVTQAYRTWTLDVADRPREYVPIMTHMAYFDGILFGVASNSGDSSIDGTTIYRSVRGRPLDFVVAITTTGDKAGDAIQTSYKVGNELITYIGGTDTGELLVATHKNLHFVEIDDVNTIFGQPTFLNRKTIPVGINNHFSLLRTLKQGVPIYYFIDTDGLRIYAPVGDVVDNENRNVTFTQMLHRAFVDSANPDAFIKQPSNTTAIFFNDYALFSVKTNYNDDNNLVAVFDNLRQQWVCFDDYDIGTIKQFAVASQSTAPTLYAITTNNKIYRLFSGERATANIKLKAITSGNLGTELKCDDIRGAFIDGTIAGTLSATQILNGYSNETLIAELLALPVQNRGVNFQGLSSQGFSMQPQLSWNTDHKLLKVQCDFEGVTQQTNIQQQAMVYS